MSKYYYPVIFFQEDDDERFGVEVPDLKYCFSEGDDLTEATKNAQEAIACYLDDVDEKDYPKPSKVSDIDISEYENAFVNIVEFNTDTFNQNYKSDKNIDDIMIAI